MYNADVNEIRCVFFFNDTATTEIYTLSLHDALPIYRVTVDQAWRGLEALGLAEVVRRGSEWGGRDRKSTRLNSSNANISYAVFCLKKKTNRLTHKLTVISPMSLMSVCFCTYLHV